MSVIEKLRADVADEACRFTLPEHSGFVRTAISNGTNDNRWAAVSMANAFMQFASDVIGELEAENAKLQRCIDTQVAMMKNQRDALVYRDAVDAERCKEVEKLKAKLAAWEAEVDERAKRVENLTAEVEQLKVEIDRQDGYIIKREGELRREYEGKVSNLKAADKESRLYPLLRKYSKIGARAHILLYDNGDWAVRESPSESVCWGSGGLSVTIAALEKLQPPAPPEPTPELAIARAKAEQLPCSARSVVEPLITWVERLWAEHTASKVQQRERKGEVKP